MFNHLIQKVLENGQVYKNYLENTKKYLEQMLSDQNVPHGKLIRSIMFYMFSGNKLTEKHFETTAIIELIHTASIIHDDVVDSNNTRRGTSSLFKLYGGKISVLKGDFLLISAFKKFIKIHKNDDFAIKYFIRENYSTAYGAVLEQKLNNSKNPSIADCIRVASLKTGPLFKLSALLGSYLSEKPFKECIQAAIYGLRFGIMFQFQNDLDSYKSEFFQNSEDYVQKNITLPVIIMTHNRTLDINDFKNQSNQENYSLIRQFIASDDFKNFIKNEIVNYFPL